MPEVHHVKVWLKGFCLSEEVDVLQTTPSFILPNPFVILFHTLESSNVSRPGLTHTKQMNGVYCLKISKTAQMNKHTPATA